MIDKAIGKVRFGFFVSYESAATVSKPLYCQISVESNSSQSIGPYSFDLSAKTLATVISRRCQSRRKGKKEEQ